MPPNESLKNSRAMCRVYRLSDIPNLKGRDIFFDANILLYLYFATPGMNHWPAKYGAVFNALVANGNRFYMDYNVLSEVVNRELKLSHQNHIAANGACPYKQWRNSVDGKNAESRTYALIKSLFLNFTVDGKVYELADIHPMLVPSSLDFTDKAIINLCRAKGYVLLTNDKDFSGVDLDILSENRSI